MPYSKKHINNNTDVLKDNSIFDKNNYYPKNKENKLYRPIPTQQPAYAKHSTNSVLMFALILVFASFFAYSNTLSNGYVMDDIEVVQQNAYVTKGFNGIISILTTPHLKGFMNAPNETYRPLSLITFAIEYQFFGANSTVNHFFNVLFFAGCVVLLFLFLHQFFGRKKAAIAFMAAMVFALHPIHTEVVANIKSCDELLCYFFAFLSLNCFFRYAQDGKNAQLILGAFSLFLSFIAKETIITFLGIIPLLFFFYKNEKKERSYIVVISTISIAVLFLLIRFFVLKVDNNSTIPINSIDNFLVGAPNLETKIATAILIMGTYLKLLVLPYPLLCDYSVNTIPFVTFTNWQVWVSMLAYISLSGICIFRLLKNYRETWVFGILFYLICISLFTNLPFFIGSPINERFTFFASTGFCIIIAVVIGKLMSNKNENDFGYFKNPKIWVVLLPLIFISSNLTIARNAEWVDNYTLYSSDLAKAPNNSRLNYCVGYELVANKYDPQSANLPAQKQILNDGILKLRKAVAINPNFSNAQIEIGNAYFLAGQYDSAAWHDSIAIHLKPEDPIIYNNLAGVYFVGKKYSLALQYCKKSVQIKPDFVNAINNEGLCFYNLQQYDSAILYFKKAIATDAGYADAYKMLANTYTATGNTDSAKKYSQIKNK